MKEEKSKLPGSETLLKLYLTKTAAEIGKETGTAECAVRKRIREAKNPAPIRNCWKSLK